MPGGAKYSFHYTNRCLEDRRNLASESTGAFCGEASICYAYQAMYRITGEMVFLEYAEKHSQLLPELIEKDTVYDLVYGNAGAVLILCSMYELTSSEAYLRLARRAADILAANVKKQEKGGGWPNRASQAALAGMSHGGSGFLPGLAKLDYLLKSTEYEPACRKLSPMNAAFTVKNGITGRICARKRAKGAGRREPGAMASAVLPRHGLPVCPTWTGS